MIMEKRELGGSGIVIAPLVFGGNLRLDGRSRPVFRAA